MVPVTTIVGRLADDPKQHRGTDKNGNHYFLATMDVLSNEYVGKDTPEKVHNFRILWTGTRAEKAIGNFRKGALVQANTEIRKVSWKDQHGNTQYNYEFRVTDISILSNPRPKDAPDVTPDFDPTAIYGAAISTAVSGTDPDDKPF